MFINYFKTDGMLNIRIPFQGGSSEKIKLDDDAFNKLSITLVACEGQDKTSGTTQIETDKDNTGQNVRDRDTRALSPMDQSEKEGDRTITQTIRQALMADGSLSTNAKNIKIISINGVVTLRGPVASSKERDLIDRKSREVRGVVKVDNQLEITRQNR